IVDAMFGALAQIVPDRVPAAGEGGNTVVCLGGYREDGSPFIIVDMICGAWGGRPDKDGIEAITNPSQNLSNTPVETMESQHPVRVEEYALVPDSCGAGEYRGGLGVARSYRLLADEASLQLRADRMKIRPYGLAGGNEAGPAVNEITTSDGNYVSLPSKINRKMDRGELVRHVQPGGGGFGDPFMRDPQRVARDVWNTKISAGYAREHHRVVVDPDTGELDEAATAVLRGEG
ncbi:MAG TPA: 5-oxoprolinase, partial [Rhodospirillaceae bacterium]|nr:5-oxoprolinase [Rhodospirillaceae bacterium]